MLLSLSAIFTGCLKDKGFEEQIYGIKDPSGQPLGISFPATGTNGGSLDVAIDALATAQTVSVVDINLEGNEPAAADIHVNLVMNPTLVADYNTQNGTSLIALPVAQYTANLKVTIAKGQRLGSFKLVLPNSSLISPINSYGMGLSIASIDEPGYIIAANLKNIVLNISIKNKFDGVYKLKSKMLDWLNNTPFNIDNAAWTWPGEVFMITSGPNSVKMYDDYGFSQYIHPIKTTTAWSAFGSTEPKFIFDNTANTLTDCVNDFVNPSNGRAFLKNAAITTSRWDPATKNIYAAIIMKQPGRSDLQIFDTLIYVRAR